MRYRSRGIGALAVLALAVMAVVGCAPEPASDWQPPQPANTVGVRFAPTHGAVFEGELHNNFEAREFGLLPGRLRNDAVGVAARFIYVPGANAFNTYVDEWLWNAIRSAVNESPASQASYVPQVFSDAAGLGDRGCVPGSSSWEAGEVLTRPETAPVVSPGSNSDATVTATAVTCDILDAFGDTIVVSFRTVSGSVIRDVGESADPQVRVVRDDAATVVLDVRTGAVSSGLARWNETSATELWHLVAEFVRQQAGTFSTASLQDPGPEQLELATAALMTATHVVPAAPVWGKDVVEGKETAQIERDGNGNGNGNGDGDSGNAAQGAPTPQGTTESLRVKVPAGIFAEEFVGLGLPATDRVMEFELSSAVYQGWFTDEWRTHLEARDEPFRAVLAPAAHVSVDCRLLPCVALTYDDGPSDLTPRLLDTLAEEQATVTFYMLGGYAQRMPDVVRRAVSEGHEIGSHSMWHPDLTLLEVDEARDSVLDAVEVLRHISGAPVTTYRPPYGAINTEIIEAINMPAVNWSIDPEDWKLPGAEALYKRVVETAWPGAIILLHDVHAETVAASGDLVRGLHDRGFTLVTVTELFEGQLPVGVVRGR